MAGLFGISVSSSVNDDFFRESLYMGTFYVRHLAEENSGLSSANGYKLICESKAGFFAANFEGKMKKFSGLGGIGYCGSYKEPFWARGSKFGPFSLCFNGNIFNREVLKEEFSRAGHLLERGDDSELITLIIVQGKDILEGINMVRQRVQGAYSFLLLSKDGNLFAVRCISGQWPLILGKHETKMSMIVSSESIGFDNMKFNVVREVEPGETCCLANGKIISTESAESLRVKRCSFYPVYTSNPAALVDNVPATLIRKELGASLAKKDIVEGFIPHIVIPVNDSGRFHGIGYFQEYCRQFMLHKISRLPFWEEHLIKYGFIRSFLGQTAVERKRRAYFKIVISAETIKHFLDMLEEAELQEILDDILSNGRIIIVICDDSVVRGTQVGENLAPKIRRIFEKEVRGVEIKAEIHVRASYPELLSYCPHGKTTKKGELLAESTPDLGERAKKLGVQSLRYNTINNLFAVLGSREGFCYDCALPQSE